MPCAPQGGRYGFGAMMMSTQQLLSNELNIQLMNLWEEIFSCRDCGLPEGYSPQFRPIGVNYEIGGIAFAQINPGHICTLSEEGIQERYKRENSRKLAREKVGSTNDLVEVQNFFIESPSTSTWQKLCDGYRHAMRHIWGWPPGKYFQMVEKHGVNFDTVAIINLAQCPVPNDKYTNTYFTSCWSKWTHKLIGTLRPKTIVAQGKAAYNFLLQQDLPVKMTVVEGIHHASRQSDEAKQKVFDRVKQILND